MDVDGWFQPPLAHVELGSAQLATGLITLPALNAAGGVALHSHVMAAQHSRRWRRSHWLRITGGARIS